MAYIKQTWADDPATSSPLSAARLNHIEDGIDGAVPAHDLMTRTLHWSNGGQGIPTGVTATNWSFRFAVRLEDTPTRFRFLLSNCDTWTPATKTAQTLATIKYGVHSRTATGSSLGAETGDFTGATANSLFSGSSTIPGDYSQLATPWYTSTLSAGTEYLFALAGSGASSTLPGGIGRCWYWNNTTSAVDPTVLAATATNQTSYVPLDVVLEYEVTSRRKAVLFLGDSIFEGTTAARGTATSPTSILRGPVNQWARRAGLLVQNHSLYGVAAQRIAVSTDRSWTRQPIANGYFDAAVIELGTNDIDNSRTTAQIKTDLETIVGLVQTAIGTDKPIYAVNLTARGYTSGSAQETTRTDLNSWLATLPFGITGIIDADKAMRSTSATASDAALLASDGIHPSHQGQGVLAGALTSTVLL